MLFYQFVLLFALLAAAFCAIAWKVLAMFLDGDPWIKGGQRRAVRARWRLPMPSLFAWPGQVAEQVRFAWSSWRRTTNPEPEIPATESDLDRIRSLAARAKTELGLVTTVSAPEPARGGGGAAPVRSYDEEVQARLERAFDLYEAKAISLDAYKRIVKVEHEAAQLRLAQLLQAIDPQCSDRHQSALTSVRSAIEAIEWCLGWARTLDPRPA